MNQISTLRYIDAFYSKEQELSNAKFTLHIALGKVISASQDSIIISFTEKNGKPWKGLLIPREALVLNKKNSLLVPKKIKDLFKNMKKNASIGIFWKDLVYFENGILPTSCSTIYTEGVLFSSSPDTVVIKDPETIEISPKKIANHPKIKPSFYIIPKSLITSIEYYGE